MAKNTYGSGGDDHLDDDTRQFERPRQIFPGEDTPTHAQSQANPQYQNYQYQQPLQHPMPQQSMPEPPRSYDAPEEKRSSGGMTGVLIALLLLALIALAALGYMYTRAANQAPPAPVTQTQTATATVTQTPSPVTQTETATTTVTTTPELTRQLPTSLPRDLGEGADNVDDLLNDIFGGDSGNSRGGRNG